VPWRPKKAKALPPRQLTLLLPEGAVSSF
jgi:hypothetical protein